MPATLQYVWIGDIAGDDWGDPANWQDVTDGLNPALVPPDGTTAVTINAVSNAVQVINATGTANSYSLKILGPTDLVGQYTTGSLDFEANTGVGNPISSSGYRGQPCGDRGGHDRLSRRSHGEWRDIHGGRDRDRTRLWHDQCQQ
jgi:hypothetical protein